MGLRDTLNQNPRLTAVATALVIAAGVPLITWQTLAEPAIDGPAGREIYFSADDGATFVPAPAEQQFAEFTIHGKEAVVAHVFQCVSTGQTFVGYLERYTPEARAILRGQSEQAKGPRKPVVGQVEAALRTGRQVKRPKDAKWLPIDSPAAETLMQVKCPDGKGDAVEVRP